MIGKAFGHFVIIRRIGAGGMGEIYLARDTHLEREVAIKVLPVGTLAVGSAARRFHEEALALSHLNHPNIATIHDFATADGIDYLVMEYVPGETLSEIVARGPMAESVIRDLGCQLADGLAAAHREGVIHRDLKPENIRVTPDGRLKILDFGLARQLKAADVDLATATATTPGTLLGTPAYMSPEQIRGEPAGSASDLFSMGVVLYQMMTGRLPFEAPSVESLTYKIVHTEPPSLSTLRPELPPVFGQLLQDLLRKNPGDRLASASEVAQRLGRQGATHPRRRAPLRLVAAAAALLVATAAFIYLREPGDAFANRAGEGVIRRLTSTGSAATPAWSPDGKHIAYVGRDPAGSGRTGICLTTPEGKPARWMPGPWTWALAWGWMPDSQAMVAYGADSLTGRATIYRAGLDGSVSVLANDAMLADISRDARTLAFTATDSNVAYGPIWLLDLATGIRRKLVDPQGEGTAVYKPKWAPDGQCLSYIRWNGRGHEIWLVNADGSDDHRIETGPVQAAGQYSWTPDGRAVVIAGEMYGLWSLWRIPVNGGDFQQLTVSPDEDRHVSLAPDGRRFVFMRSEDISRIALLDVGTGALDYPFEVGIGAHHPTFSPDGSKLYFHGMVNGRWQVWQAALDGSGQAQTMIGLGDVSAFAPIVDGQGRVLHLRAQVGRQWRWGRIEWSQTLWAVAPDGKAEVRLLPDQERVERMAPGAFLSPNLLFTSNTKENREALFVQRPGESPLEIFEDNAERSVAAFDWGPEVEEVLLALRFEDNADYSASITALNIRTSEMRHLLKWGGTGTVAGGGFGRVSAIALAPDGRRLALIGADATGRRRAIHLVELKTGAARLLHTFEDKVAPQGLTWSHDGKRLAVELGEASNDLYLWEPQSRVAASVIQ